MHQNSHSRAERVHRRVVITSQDFIRKEKMEKNEVQFRPKAKTVRMTAVVTFTTFLSYLCPVSEERTKSFLTSAMMRVSVRGVVS